MSYSKTIIPVSDLKVNLYKVINELEEHGKIIVTQNSKPKAVIADIQHYENLENTANALYSFDPEALISLLDQREAEIKSGEYATAEAYFKKMDAYVEEKE